MQFSKKDSKDIHNNKQWLWQYDDDADGSDDNTLKTTVIIISRWFCIWQHKNIKKAQKKYNNNHSHIDISCYFLYSFDFGEWKQVQGREKKNGRITYSKHKKKYELLFNI